MKGYYYYLVELRHFVIISRGIVGIYCAREEKQGVDSLVQSSSLVKTLIVPKNKETPLYNAVAEKV